MLRIFLQKSGINLFSCEWVDGLESNFHIQTKSNHFLPTLLVFAGVSMHEDYQLKKKTPLSLVYSIDGVNDFNFGEYEIENANHLFLKKEMTSIFAMFYTHQNIDLLLFRILRSWAAGQDSFDWRSFKLGSQKGSWLRACLGWNNSPLRYDDLQSNKMIQLSLSDFDSHEGFYCGLGEAILGAKGYMGQDLDGFDECLGIILKTNESNLYISITNADEERVKSLFGRKNYISDMIGMTDKFNGRLKFIIK